MVQFFVSDLRGLLSSDFSGGNQRLWQGRSAGPNFSAMRNWGKNRQRRGLPPPCGIHPAVLDAPAFSLFRPLAWWGHMDGVEILRKVPAPLCGRPSIARALPWYATVPSYRRPGSRRRERRLARIGPDVEIAWR